MSSFEITPYINVADLKTQNTPVTLPTFASYSLSQETIQVSVPPGMSDTNYSFWWEKEEIVNQKPKERTTPLTQQELEQVEMLIKDFWNKWPTYTNPRPYKTATSVKPIPAYKRKLRPFKLSLVTVGVDSFLAALK